MNREEKINAIYKEMVKEVPIYWSVVEKYRTDWTDDRSIFIWDILSYISDVVWEAHTARHFELKQTYEEMYRTDFMKLMRVWDCYHKKLEDQPDECIDFVYFLIKK